MAAWQESIERAESTDRWRRVAGLSGLSSRCLAIVREVWAWRDQEAQRRNEPPKRILRDDLIVELARRKTADLKRIRAVRGLEHQRLQRHLPAIAKCIQRALNLPDPQCPRPQRRNDQSHLVLIGQFLNAALSSICRSASVAPAIVGTAQDVRDLIAYRLNLLDDELDPPALACGWRAEVVGIMIDELLSGRMSIRISDPLSEHPLSFDRNGEEGKGGHP
jgi:ribonuclease D